MAEVSDDWPDTDHPDRVCDRIGSGFVSLEPGLSDLSIVIDLWCCPGVEQSLDRPLSAGWDWRPLGAQIGRVNDTFLWSSQDFC
jgi:hypothetical protein